MDSRGGRLRMQRRMPASVFERGLRCRSLCCGGILPHNFHCVACSGPVQTNIQLHRHFSDIATQCRSYLGLVNWRIHYRTRRNSMWRAHHRNVNTHPTTQSGRAKVAASPLQLLSTSSLSTCQLPPCCPASSKTLMLKPRTLQDGRTSTCAVAERSCPGLRGSDC